MVELYMRNKTDAFAPMQGFITMKKQYKGDTNESNITDGRYFSNTHYFISNHMVYDCRSCRKCRSFTAGKKY